MHTLALLATYQETDTSFRILARYHGAPLWVTFEGEALEIARDGILAHYLGTMTRLETLDADTVVMHNVHINGPYDDTAVTAQAWSWSTLYGWQTGTIFGKAA